MDVTEDWYWEGNVVEALADHLTSRGWVVVSKADTRSKERGMDIHAERDGRVLLVEAKGYPSNHYRDPARFGELKPTNPKNQAQNWYAKALLKIIRLQSKHPNACVALAFPDFGDYRKLLDETRIGLEKLGVGIFFVGSDRQIDTWGLN